MSTESLEQAFASTHKILENVGPDQLDRSTPCASWDVRQLINHIVGGSHYVAETTESGQAPEFPDTDFAAGDAVTSYDEGIRAALAAFGAPGAEEKMLKLPFGEIPGAVFLGIVTSDQFVHGWDLAKATGQPTDLDPVLAGQLLEGVRAIIADEFRGPDGTMPFGPKVEAPDSAPPVEQLAAFLGRRI